jgi:hypothetical protein
MSEQQARSPITALTASPIWQDLTARRLLVLGVLISGLHFIVVAILLPRLPAEVPLHMAGNGAVLLSGPPNRLFLPVLFGLMAWLINLIVGVVFYLRRDEPAIAYLLWGASLAVQVGAWLSLLVLLP